MCKCDFNDFNYLVISPKEIVLETCILPNAIKTSFYANKKSFNKI